jgi:hypothetical protein
MKKMTIPDENTKTKEQNKNKKLVPEDFYHQLKVILEQDEFDIFKTRSKKRLETKLNSLEQKIQRLLSLKLRSTDTIKKLSGQKKIMKSKNLELKKEIIQELDLEVE